jgi:hypothetical protein
MSDNIEAIIKKTRYYYYHDGLTNKEADIVVDEIDSLRQQLAERDAELCADDGYSWKFKCEKAEAEVERLKGKVVLLGEKIDTWRNRAVKNRSLHEQAEALLTQKNQSLAMLYAEKANLVTSNAVLRKKVWEVHRELIRTHHATIANMLAHALKE